MAERLVEAAERWGVAPQDIGQQRGDTTLVARVQTEGRDAYLRVWTDRRRLRSAAAALDLLMHATEAGAAVCRPLPSRSGRLIEEGVDGPDWWAACVVTEAPGVTMERVAPTPAVAAAWGETLGVFHRVIAGYEPPAPLVFPSSSDLVRWTTARLPPDDAALGDTLNDVSAWLRSLPRADGAYGLTHGDNRSANVLWDGARAWLIDLDEPVWDWYVSDVARALLDWAERPRNERERVQQWFVDGYRRARTLEDAQVAWISRFVQLRALHRYVWFHAEGRATGEGDRRGWRDWAVGAITW